MKKIWIRHPDLTDRGPIEVPESALRFHVNAGWEQVPDDEVPTGEGGVPQPTVGDQVDKTESDEDARGASTRKRATKSAENKKETED